MWCSRLGHTPIAAILLAVHPSCTIMYSTLNRLNHLSSLATTYILILLGLISISSLITLPTVNIGKVDIKDLIV